MKTPWIAPSADRHLSLRFGVMRASPLEIYRRPLATTRRRPDPPVAGAVAASSVSRRRRGHRRIGGSPHECCFA
jgi:hypothetical protein